MSGLVTTRSTRATIDLDDPSLYLNRELSLLAFQARVLEEAQDPANPLLERAKFLAIFSSNLAEFFMVRVAGLKQQIEAGVGELSDDGLTAAEQLAAVRLDCTALFVRGRIAFSEIRAGLAENGIHILDYGELSDAERADADAYFTSTVFPVLTPLAFDPGRPFPHISNLSLNLAVVVRDKKGQELFARLKVPRSLPRLVPLPRPDGAGREHRFVWLDQLVKARLGDLFPGMEIVEAHAFRVTRDAEMAIQDLEADDLLESIEVGVRRRRFGSVVRMTVEPDMPEHMRDILVENLKMDPADVVPLEPPLGMSDLASLGAIDRPDLKFPPFVPATTVDIAEEDSADIFSHIRDHDILLHHPYDSFEPVVAFLQQAARDPDVLAIKMTLYRVGKDSPIVRALLDAAAAGKEVAVLVELKARFDEESNIGWARALEHEGVHVVYGLVGLKTHSKVALVVRREGEKIRRYVHVGTGNYNIVTAKLYTDFGLLTADPRIGVDASELFNLITGYAGASKYKRFLVAPANLRKQFEQLVRREMEHAREGRGGRVIFKMNSLVDKRIVRLLYEASQAGVEMDLIVRGVCCLRPGLPGLSETVRVKSILGRFLEHSRVYYFENAGEPTVLIGSGDLMTRNLDRRVEVLAPVMDAQLIERLRNEVLATYLADDLRSHRMLPDGSYERMRPAKDGAGLDSQAAFVAGTQLGRKPGKKKPPGRRKK